MLTVKLHGLFVCQQIKTVSLTHAVDITGYEMVCRHGDCQQSLWKHP